MDDNIDSNNGNEPLNDNDTNNEGDSMNNINDNVVQHDASSSAAANNNNSQGAPSIQNNTQDDAPSLSNNSAATDNNNTANECSTNNNNSPSAQPTAQGQTTQATNSNNQIIRQPQSTTQSNSSSIHPTLPFLITHWLSNYTAASTLSSAATSSSAGGSKEKEKALQTIQNQSIILANAFETLGEFGTSSSTALMEGLKGKVEEGNAEGTVEGIKEEGNVTRSTTYSDLKRKYSPLLQIGNGSSISKVGSNQCERYVHIYCNVCVYCFYVVVRVRLGN